ncbi:MAG: ArsR/SmtB family transcription factor [Eubacteriaceae bacterium]
MNKDYEKTSEIFKALGHPVRLCVMHKIIENGRCNVTFLEECLDTSQSGISQHLSKLKNVGIIKGTRVRNEIFYEILDEKTKILVENFLNESN